jgi:ABC-type nitrate/sulfonate/bicarbonate transport system ATPase subunit
MTDPAPAALSITGLHKSFGQQTLLRDVDLQLAPGERLCITGRSGLGKSTLLRIIAGLETADAGSIEILGRSAMANGRQKLQPWDRSVQMIFQDLGLWPTRTVLANVVDTLRAQGLAKAKARETALEILQRLGLAQQAEQKPATLSGGEGRRLALARCLVVEPTLLLLDEPFTSLDPETREQSFELLLSALKQSHAAVILVSHDATEAARLGGRQMHLHAGGGLSEGSPVDPRSQADTELAES